MSRLSENIIEFTLLFNRFKKEVYNYVQKMVKDYTLTDDIVQNVFIKLYENLESIRNKNSIKFWLFTTARNEVYTNFRKNSGKSAIPESNIEKTELQSPLNIEWEFDLAEMKELLFKELDNLSSDQKEIFILREFSGLTYKEIASLLEIDIDLVKSRLYKVRQKLTNRLSV